VSGVAATKAAASVKIFFEVSLAPPTIYILLAIYLPEYVVAKVAKLLSSSVKGNNSLVA